MRPVLAASLVSWSHVHASWCSADDKVGESEKQERRRPRLTRIFSRKISEKHDKVFVTGCQIPDTTQPRANATFVVLARNKELEGVLESIKSVERHFNRWYHYPYTFLNDGDFNQTFMDTVRNHTSSPVEFGKIDSTMWGFPEWANAGWAKEGIARQGDDAIMYGGMESYHHMCRFYSG